MQLSRRRLLAGMGAVSVVGLAALAGCGEDEATTTTAVATAAPAAATAAPEAAPAAEVVEIRYVAMDYDDRMEPDTKALIEAFNASQSAIQATVDIVSWPNGLQVLTTQLQAGDPPDLANHGSGQMGIWDTEGILEPLDSLVADIKGDFLPSTLDAMTINGRLMGMPYFLDPRGLWYRTDLFEAAGISDAPGTWEEMREAAKKLHNAPDVFGIGWSAGYGDYWWYNWVGALGADQDRIPYDSDGRSKIANEDGVAGVQLMVDLTVNDATTQPGFTQANRDSDLQPLFLAGKLAMLETGSWFKTILENDAPDIPFNVAQLPVRTAGIKPSNAFWPDMVVVFKDAKNKAEAGELIKFMFNKENRVAWAQQRGVIPARPDVLSDPEWNVSKFEQFFADEIAISHNIFLTPFPATFNKDQEAQNNGAVKAVLGEMSAADAMAEAAGIIDQNNELA